MKDMNKDKVVITLSLEEYNTLRQDAEMLTSKSYLFDDDGRYNLICDFKKILNSKRKVKRI
jgi:hypothetical protein